MVNNATESRMTAKQLERRRENHREYIHKKYHDDPTYRKNHLKLVASRKRRIKKETRRLLDEFKGQGCAICHEKEPCCLSAHHRDPKKKSFNIAMNAGNYSVQAVIDELSKCTCLCENCHRKVHAGVLKLPH